MTQYKTISAPIFDDKEAKTFIADLFDNIGAAKSIEDLELIPNRFSLEKHLKKYAQRKFPRLRLRITEEDVNTLKKIGVLPDKMQLSPALANGELTSHKMSALKKLLYAVLWKNGDLGKEHHLMAGIIGNVLNSHSFVAELLHRSYKSPHSRILCVNCNRFL